MMRNLLAIAVVVPVLALGADANEDVFSGVVKRNFPDSALAGGVDPKIPRGLVADFNGDGRQDALVVLRDAATDRHGEGCYAFGIVNDYLRSDGSIPTFHQYECLKAIELVRPETVALKLRNVTAFRMRPVGPCVQLTLRYDDQRLVCWHASAYRSFESDSQPGVAQPRVAATRQ